MPHSKLTQLQNAQTKDKGIQAANLQSELEWLKFTPASFAREQKIAELISSIDQLKNATDANTAATSATLNPLYSQGHGALAIGYYKAASGLEGIVRGSGGVDSVPVRVMATPGEHFKFTPQGQSSNDNSSRSSQPTVINNHFDLRGMDTNTARRSGRQVAQGFGQTVAAMSR